MLESVPWEHYADTTAPEGCGPLQTLDAVGSSKYQEGVLPPNACLIRIILCDTEKHGTISYVLEQAQGQPKGGTNSRTFLPWMPCPRVRRPQAPHSTLRS